MAAIHATGRSGSPKTPPARECQALDVESSPPPGTFGAARMHSSAGMTPLLVTGDAGQNTPSSSIQHAQVEQHTHTEVSSRDFDSGDNASKLPTVHAMHAQLAGLCCAPMESDPIMIAGRGVWAADNCDYKEAKVLGIDLASFQSIPKPPSVKFITADVETEWSHEMYFIYAGNLTAHPNGPAGSFKHIFDNMRPNEWVEFRDIDLGVHCGDGSLPDDWPLKTFNKLLAGSLGITQHAAGIIDEHLAAAGFTNIKSKAARLPCGTWPADKKMREIGEQHRKAVETLFGPVKLSSEESWDLFTKCGNAMRDPQVHAYSVIVSCIGQKPRLASTRYDPVRGGWRKIPQPISDGVCYVGDGPTDESPAPEGMLAESSSQASTEDRSREPPKPSGA